MSEFHFIAVPTFGKERHENLPAFRLGLGVRADVLLTLLGNQARELTSPRTDYRYVHLDVKDARTWHNHLVLRITSEEKGRVEAICRTNDNFTCVFLWEHERQRWLEFPGMPAAHYVDASTRSGADPKFLPVHAAFITPSRLAEKDETPAKEITVHQSGNWWWLAGDTYPHKEALKTAGARWSKTRRQWYFIGDTLPASIQTVVNQLQAPTPAASPEIETTSQDNPVPASVSETENDPPEMEYAGESLMRSVRTDDVTAALVAHIYDNERGKPILIDFIGSRNAVKQLLGKPFNPAYMGVRAESHAFTIVDGSRYSGFRLPDNNYKTMTATLGGRVVEGRIVALDATTSAPRTECYVLVMNRIDLPRTVLAETIENSWLRYIRYRQTPNRQEFAEYVPPAWVSDLYNVYQALRVRIGRPLHERWMPWLFTQVADKPVSSETSSLKGITLCKYIPGYIDAKAKGVIEGGAYRLTCRDLSNLWAEILIRNPNRAEGITFGGTE